MVYQPCWWKLLTEKQMQTLFDDAVLREALSLMQQIVDNPTTQIHWLV